MFSKHLRFIFIALLISITLYGCGSNNKLESKEFDNAQSKYEELMNTYQETHDEKYLKMADKYLTEMENMVKESESN